MAPPHRAVVLIAALVGVDALGVQHEQLAEVRGHEVEGRPDAPGPGLYVTYINNCVTSLYTSFTCMLDATHYIWSRVACRRSPPPNGMGG